MHPITSGAIFPDWHTKSLQGPLWQTRIKSRPFWLQINTMQVKDKFIMHLEVSLRPKQWFSASKSAHFPSTNGVGKNTKKTMLQGHIKQKAEPIFQRANHFHGELKHHLTSVAVWFTLQSCVTAGAPAVQFRQMLTSSVCWMDCSSDPQEGWSGTVWQQAVEANNLRFADGNQITVGTAACRL